ncbi:3-keto-5-aminohexanoate cleavage protein [Halobaculum lipolyticum]|uniref:3-keto-5-aminohexanoate cleavage protein n=1 Tax=Halobaculum lipolyticum TaxID=3032001 RepID=A0ABD5W6P7_9EURY|nr:3-keto-5-aminohexanoate cleavage protein [Halobaculum sp. DT31]
MTYQDYLDQKPVILTAALTGGVHGKDANPNLPEQPDEIAREARACERLGASIVHVHGRDRHGENDTGRLQAVTEAIHDRCDDIVVQHSTGGQGPLRERIKALRTDPAPEMASLDLGPFKRDRHIITDHTRDNIDTLAREMRRRNITPELEVFNGGQLAEVTRLAEDGLIDRPFFVNLVFGGANFTPPRPGAVLELVRTLPEGSEFNLLATGRHQRPLTTLAVLLGGHVRVGMEDNLYSDRGVPAESNAQLLERTVATVESLDRPIATPEETRAMLDIEGDTVGGPRPGDELAAGEQAADEGSACPFLAYRSEGDGRSFDHERPYCTVADEFVSPMQADVCNDRFDFDHRSHCDVYREYVESETAPVPEEDD